MTENEAQKQSGEIISNALSAASEILNLSSRSAQEMIDISQKLADRIIQAAKELSGSTVKSAVKPQHVSVRTSKVFSVGDVAYLVSKLGSKCNGKRTTIRGEIAEIEEYDARFRVTLSEYEDEEYDTRFRVTLSEYHENIYCYFSFKWESAILSLKCGQIITISGKFHIDDDYYNELLGCEILRDKIISTAQETSGVSVQPRSVSRYEVVSVASVFREYKENHIAAKRKYEGRRITVRGKAYNIVGNEQELWFRLGEHNEDDYKLECYFLPEWESLIHTLKKGDTITVNGEFQYNIDALLDCEIVIAK